ncbi:SPOR domain-containing protein [Vibrio sp. SCSIO 43136]|uniref:SPOR domain-containing protein n=1 Tax=Vibrio sp. SCSIO 43136 TaxID=2819101 RepID=UPI00207505B8|nr:SPOR domain-containing protein [Vibrio sp. SCSIO 43136]USD68224.1 SPOR domain-containing protein [Vibrio sp. SCSIO 43136]
MKKVTIIALSMLLAACASDTYEKGVTTESYREDYQVDTIAAPLMAEEAKQDIKEEAIVASKPEPTEQKPMKAAPAPTKKKVKILPPTEEHLKMNPRYGFTIQVIAVDSEAKLPKVAEKLPNGQPVWGNYKLVNGTKWYTVLYGDYASRAEAKAAIANLPAEFRKLKPFTKSIDDIKNSAYPTLDKLK